LEECDKILPFPFRVVVARGSPQVLVRRSAFEKATTSCDE
jgi:hypothetical protein